MNSKILYVSGIVLFCMLKVQAAETASNDLSPLDDLVRLAAWKKTWQSPEEIETGLVSRMVFSHDDKHLAIAAQKSSRDLISILDLQQMDQPYKTYKIKDTIYFLAWLPGQNKIRAATSCGFSELDLETGRVYDMALANYEKSNSDPCAMSQNGKKYAVFTIAKSIFKTHDNDEIGNGNTRKCKIYDLDEKKQTMEILTDRPPYSSNLASFSADGSKIAIAHMNNIELIELESNARRIIDFQAYSILTLSPDGTHLTVNKNRKDHFVLDLQAAQVAHRSMIKGSAVNRFFSRALFSADGKTHISYDIDLNGEIIIADVTSDKQIHFQLSPISLMAVDSKAQHLALCLAPGKSIMIYKNVGDVIKDFFATKAHPEEREFMIKLAHAAFGEESDISDLQTQIAPQSELGDICYKLQASSEVMESLINKALRKNLKKHYKLVTEGLYDLT